MQFSIASFLWTLLSLFATLSLATPILEVRDIFLPPVLQPAAGTVWQKGTVQTVVWDASNPPAQLSNPLGEIFLSSVETGLILLDAPLADGFSILEGSQTVTVPSDVPVGLYQVVLVGNSGNLGPVFSIVD